ncbi:hypothetical protein KY385_03450 [Candidatus Parcubacteria bacterium]|nr:hypothetical protein [Candidatus Parcubacteria bacterium]
MHKVSFIELFKLINTTGAKAPAVTIYLPTHKASTPPNMSEDQTRFKNLYKKALEILDNRDKHNEFNKEFARKCEELLENRAVWEDSSESKLLCARPDTFEYFNLPIDSDEHASVSNHFFLAPVLGLLDEFVVYYVLQISLNKPRLLKGDAYGLEESGIELPESLEIALNIDEMHQKSVQHHSVSGPKGAEFHGHGGGKDTGDPERQRYFRIIDEVVCKKADKKLPLILAGVDSEISEYRSLSRYPKILEKSVEGHYPASETAKLHELSKAVILQEVSDKPHKQVLARLSELRGSPGRVSERTADIKDAAEKGRVGTLLVGMSKKTRDTVRDNLEQVRKIIFPGDIESQSLDYISSLVVSNGGKIINISLDEMPGNNFKLSINRY